MSRFEFNAVLVSILLAFAAAELVAIWARVIRARSRYGFSWPFFLFTLWLFFGFVLHWFGFWSYREVPFDVPWHSLVALLPALTLALVARVLALPNDTAPNATLDAHHFATARIAMPLGAAFMGFNALSDHLLPGVLEAPPLAYGVVAAASIAALGWVRAAWVHVLVLGANLLAGAVMLVGSRT